MARTRRRILYVNHEVECGGAELSLLDLLEGLDRERFEPLLACSGEGPLAERADASLRFVPMLFDGKLRKLLGLRRAARTLAGLARGEGIALIHANTLIAGYCGLWAARRSDVPLVWHLRDLTYPAVAKRFCRKASVLVANSRATADSVGAPGTRVVFNGVGPEFFDPALSGAEVRRELGVAPSRAVFGMVGRLDPWKGHEDLLEAAARLPEEAEFWVVGDVVFQEARERLAGYREELERRARELRIEDRVRFLGRRTDIPRILAALDVLVHPSREPEPFGRSVAEAQACGKPVVATRAGGIPEVIEEGRTGLLVEPRDRDALAGAMRELLRDPDRARRMGEAGRARAREFFTIERHAARIQAIYEELL